MGQAENKTVDLNPTIPVFFSVIFSRLDKKQDPIICRIQETQFKNKVTSKLKVKGF